MTLDQLVTKTIVLQALLLIVKVIFFRFLNMDLLPILVVYYILTAALGIAVVRRIGAINYFEAFFLIIVWLVLGLVTDYYIVAAMAGREALRDIHYWITYGVIILSILLFHKKVHVEVRKGNMTR